MKILICCNNGANVQSKRKVEMSTDDLGISEAEWTAMTDEQKQAVAVRHVKEDGWIEIWYEEI